MRTRVLARAALRSIPVEQRTGEDAEGVPVYDSPISIQARPVRKIEEKPNAEGGVTMLTLMLYVPGDADYVPGEGDRLTEAGDTFIVDHVDLARTLEDELDHATVRCRDE